MKKSTFLVVVAVCLLLCPTLSARADTPDDPFSPSLAAHVGPQQTIQVTWRPYLDPDCVGYELYRDAGTGDSRLLATLEGGGQSVFTDREVSLGVVYSYSLRAKIQRGSSETTTDFSEAVSAALPPQAPVLSGTREDDYSTVALSWTAADGASAYEVHQKILLSGRSSDFELRSETTDLSFTESGKVEYHDYRYKVRAYIEVDGTKLYGQFSNSVDLPKDPDSHPDNDGVFRH